MNLSPLLTQAQWQRVISIVDEAAVGLVRTSYSQVVRDFNDFACGVFDAHGNLLAHSTRTTTLFIGVMPYVMRTFLERFPAATLKDGDVLVTNDPWLGAGHTYDFCVASPVFHQGVLAGFAFSIVHHLDVGGRMGAIDARDIYEEGIRVPMLKLFEAGMVNPVARDIISANVRAPDKLFGDLRAQVVANNVCARGLTRMLDDYRLPAAHLTALSEEICARAERSLRARIAELPDGVFENEITLPPIGHVSGIRLHLALTIAGDQIHLDFSGSSGEVGVAVNVPMNMTRSYSVYAIKLAIDNSEVPNNEGSMRPVTVSVPEGTLLNCRPPAATCHRTLIVHHLPELIFGALEKVIPQSVMAACGSTPLVTIRFGQRLANGDYSMGMNTCMGGLGATARNDGASCRGFPYNVSSIPIESIENDHAVVYLRKELLPDSGGPGRYRGGLGQVTELEVLPYAQAREPMVLGIRGSGRKEDSVHPVLGRFGGGAGRGEILTFNGRAIPYGPQQVAAPGDRLCMAVPGGGGYGSPEDRSVEEVVADVAHGYVGQEAALKEYGVQFRPDGTPDHTATEKLRAAMRRAR